MIYNIKVDIKPNIKNINPYFSFLGKYLNIPAL